MQLSKIEWTHFTSNPLKYRDATGKIVWGCVHKSGGCKRCYAEALARRYGRGKAFTAAHMAALTPFVDEKELRHIRRFKKASGKRCFLGDMTDVFGEWVPDGIRDQIWNAMAYRNDVTFQVLTKRPEVALKYLSDSWGIDVPENIWLGVSAEDQKTADERIPLLLRTPVKVRFVSYEPALGPVDFSAYLNGRPISSPYPVGLDWIIVGGESGPDSRSMNIDWARTTVRACKQACVPVFVKQLGAKPVFEHMTIERLQLKSRKGADVTEWPIDLRVRQFPERTNA